MSAKVPSGPRRAGYGAASLPLCRMASLASSIIRRAARAQQRTDVVDLVVQQVDLARQSLDIRGGATIHFEVQLAAQTVLRVLSVLTHHDDRRLDCGQHRQEQIEQDEWVRVPGPAAQADIEPV